MLTKTDLEQIKKVVREEIEAEGELIKDELSNDIRTSRMEVVGEIREQDDRLKNIEIDIRKIKKVINPLEISPTS